MFSGVILKSSITKKLSRVLLNFVIASFNSLKKNSSLCKGTCISQEEEEEEEDEEAIFIINTEFKTNNFNTSWKFIAIDYFSGNIFSYN